MKTRLFSVSRIYPMAVLLLSTVLPLSARAETIDCTAITSLPYVIATQGVYCLTGNLSTSMTSGNAITISTNNVTLDLNSYKLGGLGAGDSTNATGIYSYQRKNITIKNGIVRGFRYGIQLDDDSPYTTSSGHVITGILADQNTFVGIIVKGLGNTVSHNTVVDTGGSTLSPRAFGIDIIGASAKVVNNVVSQTTAQSTGDAVGIFLGDANYSLVQNNTVTDTTSPDTSTWAITMQRSTGVFIRNNNVANATNGIFYPFNSSGKYFNNLTFDVTTPFTGGTAIGGNNN